MGDPLECPFCAEVVQAKAIACRHCGRSIAPGTCLNIKCAEPNRPEAKFCGHCGGGRLIRPPGGRPPEETGKTARPGFVPVAWIFSGVLALVLAFALTRGRPKPPDTAPPPPVPAADAPAALDQAAPHRPVERSGPRRPVHPGSFDLAGVWDFSDGGARFTIRLTDGRYSILSVVDRRDGEVYKVVSNVELRDGLYTWTYLVPSTNVTLTLKALSREGNVIPLEWRTPTSANSYKGTLTRFAQ